MSDTVHNFSQPPIRGVMIDFTRLTEDFKYYKELIPVLGQWGYNYLFAHISDDEGCAIKIENVPVIHTPGAFTPKQWMELIETAKHTGITMVPEIECLGHTGYITRQERFKELRESPSSGKRFWSISPCLDESVQIVTNVIDAVDNIFDAPFIHIGMDEADIGGGIITKNILRQKPKWEIFGEYLEKIHAYVKSKGKRTMIWGDHIHQSEDLANYISKDIIICNWLYGTGYSENYYNLTKFFSKKGFDYIGCPAAVWRGTLFVPHRNNIKNIRDFHNTLQLFPENHNLGTIITLWTPYRFLPQIPLSLLFYGARRIQGNYADETWIIEYIREQFAPKEGGLENIAEAFRKILYSRSYSMLEEILLPFNMETLEKANQPEILALAETYTSVASQSLKILETELKNIRKGRKEYDQWIISTKVIHSLSSFADSYHKIFSQLSPPDSLEFNSQSESDNSPKIIITTLLEKMNSLNKLWINSNIKYRSNYYEVKPKDNSIANLFWNKEEGDHPAQRLGLTIDFLKKLAG